MRTRPSNSGRAVICIPTTSRMSIPRGYVQITDRIKDVIKTGGEWVSSLDVEDIISQCPGVREAAVIGVKDEKWGERPLGGRRPPAPSRRNGGRRKSPIT